MDESHNRRILLVDDNPAIHGDFQKILAGRAGADSAIDAAADAFFGPSGGAVAVRSGAPPAAGEAYDLSSAFQGENALELARAARAQGRPFALAFVDVRMPPGWDGIQTLERIFAEDGDIQAVLCTAFSDYSYEQTLSKLGRSARLLILKKPFDPIEVQQLACALTQKWALLQRERTQLAEVRRAEQEARAYAASLETVNRALSTDKATADAYAVGHQEFLARLAGRLLAVAGSAPEPALRAALERVEAIARLACAHDEVVPTSCDLDALVAGVCRERAGSAGPAGPAPSGPDLEWSTGVLGSACSDPRLVAQACGALVDAARFLAVDGRVGVRFAVTDDQRAGRRLAVEARIARARVSIRELGPAAEPLALPLENPADELAYPLAVRAARALSGGLRAEDLAGGGLLLRLDLAAPSGGQAQAVAA